MNQPIVLEQRSRPGCLVQLLWFIFVGSWLGPAWVLIAWVLMVTVIGAPIGVAMINNIPQIIALRGRRVLQVLPSGQITEAPQVNIVVRALYFVLVGWWLSALWMGLAYLLCITIVFMPLGFWMFDLTPTILSLKRV